ncbi:MAG TPA: sugar ABC transporter substrate-binding protein [Thermoanaerobaculia bacterium]|nr:sugar ABC transporter substrate-binding protein [Thermoanaerobaculia bacterium]
MRDRPSILHSAFCILNSAFILLVCSFCSERADHRERIEFWGLGREGEEVGKLVPEFERRNPDLHVVVQQIPFVAAHEKLLTAYVGNATPDAAQMGNTWLPEMVALHAIDELSSAHIDQSDYFPGIWATNIVDGKLYGIPWYVDTRVIFYRKDLLASVGYAEPPKTWAAWVDCMEKLTRERKSRFGVLLPTNEPEQLVELALTAGAHFLKDDGTRGNFREPQFVDAFNFYNALFRQKLAPSVSSVQVANLYQQFAQSDFAMYVGGPWQIAEFKRRLPPGMQATWGTMPMPARDASQPVGVGMAGGSSFVIYKASKHKEAARKFIEYLSETEQQIRFSELSGDLPARRSAWKAPALANDPYLPAFREQLERVEPLPKVPEWENIATAIYEHGEAAVKGTMTIPQALADLDRVTDAILEKRRWMREH